MFSAWEESLLCDLPKKMYFTCFGGRLSQQPSSFHPRCGCFVKKGGKEVAVVINKK